ncbi:prepilin peptidase dependent protein C [Pasteurella langaaensis DSM 22999]|uniref:Prepilin peptidase dependent protein C n=1 Tax=Alitibacter langaaensis DSM 22999 TaxID=1122935 RepID=A0A2U0SM03_9PAST|nr:DUF5374 domain-containing protein [Pasteurella langaaensis]PVX32385.1 prepilin peptidase dependent protein C [Pasteurella langaaensis DSM 22999]
MISTLNQFKGMSLLTLLIVITLFSGIFLAINQWASQQRKSAVEIYQRYQAIQIAENQKQRRFLGMPCENQLHQNAIKFSIECAERITVRYPAGKITL